MAVEREVDENEQEQEHQSEAVSLSIRSLSPDGSGVGTLPSGKVIFVPRTGPGDMALVRIMTEKKSWARGIAEEIETPGEGRRVPECSLFSTCGGCAFQHLDIGVQLKAKGEFISNALGRIAGVPIPEVTVEPSPCEFRYRTRMRFTLKRLRGGEVLAGFHKLGNPGHIVDVAGECVLPEEPIIGVWAGVREAWGDGATLLPRGTTLHLTIRQVEEGVIMLVEGGHGLGRAEQILEKVPGLIAIWVKNGGKPPVLAAGMENTTEIRGGETFSLGPAAFLQVNAGASEKLLGAVIEAVRPESGLRVVDAYSGPGILARILARQGCLVTAIELDPQATDAAERDCPVGMDVRMGWVEELLPETLPADVVVVNPPRTGLDPLVTEALNEAPVSRLVYVSCDPATLARDVKRLSPVYTVESVQGFDLFPQTALVETLITLSAKAN